MGFFFSFASEGGCGVQSPLRIGGKGSPALYTLYQLLDQFLVWGRSGILFLFCARGWMRGSVSIT